MTESISAPATSPNATPAIRPATVAAQVGTFAALIAVFGIAGTIPVPGLLVPITLQTLAVMLAGAILGPRRGAAAVLTLLALAAVGLPVLAGGRGGLGAFVGPSAGYLAGWLVGAFVVGLLVNKSLQHSAKPSFWRITLSCFIGGVLAVYAIGIPVFALVTGTDFLTAATINLAYLPGDIVKSVLAGSVTVGVLRAYPAALAHRRI